MRKAIYSAVVGGYDNVVQPSVIDRSFDYILFTNDTYEKKIGVWNIRQIPYNNKDKTRIARWVKTHPHILLNDYDYSLWMDANVVIDDCRFFRFLNAIISDNSILATFDHNDRDCIYDEGFQIVALMIDSPISVLKEVIKISSSGYPFHNGLCETNVVLRKHNHHQIVRVDEDWWYMIDNYSKRDQLSFNYVTWKNNTNIKLIFGNKRNARNHDFIHCVPHNIKRNWKRELYIDCLLPKYNKYIYPIYRKTIVTNHYSFLFGCFTVILHNLFVYILYPIYIVSELLKIRKLYHEILSQFKNW